MCGAATVTTELYEGKCGMHTAQIIMRVDNECRSIASCCSSHIGKAILLFGHAFSFMMGLCIVGQRAATVTTERMTHSSCAGLERNTQLSHLQAFHNIEHVRCWAASGSPCCCVFFSSVCPWHLLLLLQQHCQHLRASLQYVQTCLSPFSLCSHSNQVQV